MVKSNNRYKDEAELGPGGVDPQTRMFLKLVFDVWEALEKYDQYFLTTDLLRSAPEWQTRGSAEIDSKNVGTAFFLADLELRRGRDSSDSPHGCD
jgi:hypothetical protein